MYKSFIVKNFRCFRDIKTEPLERINLIAGKTMWGRLLSLKHFGFTMAPIFLT